MSAKSLSLVLSPPPPPTPPLFLWLLVWRNHVTKPKLWHTEACCCSLNLIWIFVIPQEHLAADCECYWVSNAPRDCVFLCAFPSSKDRFWQESCSPPRLPQVRLVPGGMFLCGEATSLSYLPVISVGRRGTTPSLAPEPQASPGHQTAAPHSTCSLRGWLFRVCQSLLAPECVKKPELGQTVFAKCAFMGCFARLKCQQRRVYHMRQSRRTVYLDNHKQVCEC